MPSGLKAFEGVDVSTDAQKAALSQMIANQGSAGVESYKAQQKVAEAAIAPSRASVTQSNPGTGNPAAASAVGPGELTQMLASRAAQPATLGAFQAGAAANEFSQYSGMLGRANSNYMDAVGAAAPIVASQTAAQVAAINAEAEEKRRAAQAAADEAATDRDWQRITRNWAIQDRMIEEAEYKRKLAEEEEGEDTYYGSSQAGTALGWDDKTIKSVVNSKTYQDVFPFVVNAMKSLGPGADIGMVQGIIEQAMRTPDANGKLPSEVKGLRTLITAQFQGLFGRPVTRRSVGLGNTGGDTNKPPAEAPGEEVGSAFGRAAAGVRPSVEVPGVNMNGRFNYGLGNAGVLSDARIRQLLTDPNIALTQAERKVARAEAEARGIKLSS